MLRFILISLCLILSFQSFSQKKKGLKDFFRFKKQEVLIAPEPDTLYLDDEMFELDEAYIDSLLAEEIRLERALSIVHEDTNEVVLFYDVPVEVSEQLMVDSVWVTIREYYSIWSNRKVNPYQRDGVKFQDTLELPLTFEKPDLDWSLPIPNTEVTSPFGLRRWKWHYGDDMRLKVGDSVRTVFDGIVRLAMYDRYGYGHFLLIRHYNGLETLYGHLKKRLVKPGDLIKAGDVIGLGGNTGRSTGPHLHFEMRYEGNAFDPKIVFDFDNDSIRTETLQIDPSTFAYLKEARKIRYHRVRSGDTLSHISYRYGVSINKICRLNRINRKSILRIGQRLRIT